MLKKNSVPRNGLMTMLFLAVALRAGEVAPPVRIYDTGGQEDPSHWRPIRGLPADRNLDPYRTVVENGLIRITYPGRLGLKISEAGARNPEMTERAAHVMYLNLNGKYVLAQDSEYGDWVYVGSSITSEPTGCRLLQNSDEMVELEMTFAKHYMKQPPIYPFDASTETTVKKTVRFYRGHYGYVIRVDVDSDIEGERETGFGLASRPTFYFNPNIAFQRPDNSQTYVYLRQVGEARNLWGCGIASEVPYYRLVGVSPAYAGAIRSGQWHPGQIGTLYRWGLSGRAYETYVAAVPYDAGKLRDIRIESDALVVQAPKAGRYTVFSKRGDLYEPVVGSVNLAAGENRVKLPVGKAIAKPVLAPITNGTDFPEDIWRAYRRLTKD